MENPLDVTRTTHRILFVIPMDKAKSATLLTLFLGKRCSWNTLRVGFSSGVMALLVGTLNALSRDVNTRASILIPMVEERIRPLCTTSAKQYN